MLGGESPSDGSGGWGWEWLFWEHLLCSRFCSRSSTWKVPSDLNNPAEGKTPHLADEETEAALPSDLPRPHH